MTMMNPSSLSPDTLQELRELNSEDDPDFFANLMTIFVDALPNRIELIRNAVSNQNAKQLALETHALKSSAMNVGAKKMGELCFNLEMLGKSGSLVNSQSIFDQLAIESTQIKIEIENLPDVLQFRAKNK